METESWGNERQPWYSKILIMLEGAWPTIYGWINDLFFGIIKFVKFILSGLIPFK